MSKTSAISVRVDEELKTQAETVFQALGLTSSQAITLFYRQVQLQQGLPFAVRLPQKSESPIRNLSIRGKYADLPNSRQDFAERKQAEVVREG